MHLASSTCTRETDEQGARQHVQGSPFELFLQPSLVSWRDSSAQGSGLSFATAGLSAHFTVVARDEYYNLRNDWRDQVVSFSNNLEPASPTDSRSDHGISWHGSVSASVVPGTYHVSYMVTRAGLTRVAASLVATGGLMATYYDAMMTAGFESQPVMARMVQQASEGSAGGAVARGGPLRAHSVTGAGYTVRWAGLFRPQFADLYTFQTRSLNVSMDSQPTERMKLWVDNQLIIDQWVSLSYLDASPTGTHAFPAAYDYYELQMLYQSQKMDRLTVELLAAPQDQPLQPLPSSNLLSAMHVTGSPSSLTALPAPTDLDVSDVYGTFLTLSTAGVRSTFTIVSRDRFGNLRGEGGDEYLVQASDGTVSVFGELRDLGTGAYLVEYLAQFVGSYQVKVFLGSAVKHFTLFVHPGEASPQQVALSGSATSIATAGHAATFTIQAKDAFGNIRCLGSDMFSVEILGPLARAQDAGEALIGDIQGMLAPPVTGTAPTQRHLLRASYLGVLPATNLGRHTASFRMSQSGDYHLQVQHVSSHGLNATFFADPLLQDAAVVRLEPAVNYNWGSDSPYQEAGTSNQWSARWSGLLAASFSETYTFHTPIAEADERGCPEQPLSSRAVSSDKTNALLFALLTCADLAACRSHLAPVRVCIMSAASVRQQQ